MFPLYKLERLAVGQRRRKLVLLLSALEPSLGSDCGPAQAEYVCAIARLALQDDKISPAASSELELLSARIGAGDRSLALRLANHARHALLAAIGTFPAEWDLIMPSSRAGVSDGQLPARPFRPGVFAYAEDIRSPFNLGSIFRTAEAFGAEGLFLSPLCASPTHPRAIRSAMGCVDFLPWTQCSLADLPQDLPVFALETGGTPLAEFNFPERGVVLVGSEELGVSPEGLDRASWGRVSIPMRGIKASLNVGVAFGILMQAWSDYLDCSALKPF